MNDNDKHSKHDIGQLPAVAESGDVILRSHEFVWLDLETTGLLNNKPGGAYADGVVLEVALALAEDDHDGNFEIIKSWDFTLSLPPDVQMDDYVRRMHTKSGLLVECEANTFMDHANADEFLCWLADTEIGSTKGGYVLAGNSVHFDLNWIRLRLPRFAERLSHRVFDVSTLTRAADAYGLGVHPRSDPVHRALDDVRASLAITKAWRDAARGI
jgi:oligoribonuclease